MYVLQNYKLMDITLRFSSSITHMHCKTKCPKKFTIQDLRHRKNYTNITNYQSCRYISLKNIKTKNSCFLSTIKNQTNKINEKRKNKHNTTTTKIKTLRLQFFIFFFLHLGCAIISHAKKEKQTTQKTCKKWKLHVYLFSFFLLIFIITIHLIQ